MFLRTETSEWEHVVQGLRSRMGRRHGDCVWWTRPSSVLGVKYLQMRKPRLKRSVCPGPCQLVSGRAETGTQLWLHAFQSLSRPWAPETPGQPEPPGKDALDPGCPVLVFVSVVSAPSTWEALVQTGVTTEAMRYLCIFKHVSFFIFIF